TVASCSKCIHEQCSRAMVEKYSKVFVSVVCSKTCFNVAKRGTKGKRIMWHNDGSNESNSSNAILIDWLTTEGNYSRYKGGDKFSGQRKGMIAKSIAEEVMPSKGITHRTAADVYSKISAIEGQFRRAVDFLDNTGSGVQDEASLMACVKDRCPLYYELVDVMGDRAASTALCTNEDDVNSEEERLSQSSRIPTELNTDVDFAQWGVNDSDDEEATDAIDGNANVARAVQVSEGGRTTPIAVTATGRPRTTSVSSSAASDTRGGKQIRGV
ncbi:MAG: hypothetical protein ACRDL7_13620, partial [Gaiellaceae bacterium]